MSVVINGTTGVDIGAGALSFPDATEQTTAPKQIGVGQTWQDVKTTPGRAIGTTYTNNTGKPIQVCPSALAQPSGGVLEFYINSVRVGIQGTTSIASGASYASFQMIVPDGATYSCASAGSSAMVLQTWFELR